MERRRHVENVVLVGRRPGPDIAHEQVGATQLAALRTFDPAGAAPVAADDVVAAGIVRPFP